MGRAVVQCPRIEAHNFVYHTLNNSSDPVRRCCGNKQARNDDIEQGGHQFDQPLRQQHPFCGSSCWYRIHFGQHLLKDPTTHGICDGRDDSGTGINISRQSQ
jgi:hypothetical protein